MSKLANACLAVLALLTVAVPAPAGSLLSTNRHSVKRCDGLTCDPPACCRPQIVRPTTYHPPRQNRGCGKPEACYQIGCDLDSCCSVTTNCVPASAVCVSEDTFCAPAPFPVACDDSCCSTGICPELAELIQRSQTACHGWDRRDAIHKLSDRYNCREYPAVMDALVFALNDSDERVRSKAADEIGDQLRIHPNCCSVTVLNALKHALGDCDRFVRRQAEEALLAAGYDVVDGGCTLRRGTGETSCVPMSSASPAAPRTRQRIVQQIQNATMASATSAVANVSINDAAPTTLVPPPKEAAILSTPPALTPAHFEAPNSEADAPVPSASSPATAHNTAAAPGSQAPRFANPSPRRQPLRQTLSNLFNQNR